MTTCTDGSKVPHCPLPRRHARGTELKISLKLATRIKYIYGSQRPRGVTRNKKEFNPTALVLETPQLSPSFCFSEEREKLGPQHKACPPLTPSPLTASASETMRHASVATTLAAHLLDEDLLSLGALAHLALGPYLEPLVPVGVPLAGELAVLPRDLVRARVRVRV